MKLVHEDEDGKLVTLSEAYSGVGVKTDAGEFAICQRDGGIEIRLGDGPWFRWVNTEGPALLCDPEAEHDDVGIPCPRCKRTRPSLSRTTPVGEEPRWACSSCLIKLVVRLRAELQAKPKSSAIRHAARRVLTTGWDWLGDMTTQAAENEEASNFMSAMESLAAAVEETST